MARTGDHNRPTGSGRPPIRSVPGGKAGAPAHRQSHPSGHQGGRPASHPGSAPGSQPRQHSARPQSGRGAEIARVQTRRRRQRRHNYILYYIMLAVLLTVTGVILSLTVFFRVETIVVSGTAIYSEEQVLDALDVRTGDNLLRLHPDRLEEGVYDRLVQAEKVSIKRQFPNTLAVDVTDAVVTEQVLSGGFSYQISSGGRVVSLEPEAVPNVRIILGPDMRMLEPGDLLDRLILLDEEAAEKAENNEEEYTNTRRLEILNNLRNEIDRAGLLDISAVDVTDSVNLKLLYQNRFEIRLGTSSELQDKLAMFSSVLDRGSLGLEEMGILDISDPDRCIASRDLPDLPDGAARAGWKWLGPHLENFDEFFGYAGGTVAPPVESGVLVGGEEQTPDGEEIPENDDASAPSDESVPDSEPDESSGSSSAPGYVIPQMPHIGGSGSSGSSASEEDEPTSEPADLPVDEPPSEPSENDISSAPAGEDSSGGSSGPGYAMPQMPQVGGG